MRQRFPYITTQNEPLLIYEKIQYPRSLKKSQYLVLALKM